ncbi:MAG: carbamoyltransferase HypF [Candidatus Thorarchaeota archaeon]
MSKRVTIHITGIVQGVGFRPFVYREAKRLSLVGFVLNLGDAGVRIVAEGSKNLLDEFIASLKTKPPSISRIDSFNAEWEKATNSFQDFVIRESSSVRNSESQPVIPPDISMCDDCVLDLMVEKSRWYHYPFTSCAACGPRFSTITDLPYDRPNTTMNDFVLCDTCNTGYTDPKDRRYHAQTTVCDKCGPHYSLYNRIGVLMESSDIIGDTSGLLAEGSILSLQGIAGTHLVSITSNPDPIYEIRKRKKRTNRPFAIMVRDQKTAETLFEISPLELSLLTSWRRPIVLLRKVSLDLDIMESKNIQEDAIEAISPGLDTVGVMLPYAPVHHLLFDNLDESALVMTSANPSGIPMYINPGQIRKSLAGIADYFLLHDRRIFQRADDSVIKTTTHNNPVFIRRARGYVPEPLPIVGVDRSVRLISLGPEEKATASVLKSESVYTTQHIGDTNNLESLEFLEYAYKHMMHLVGLDSFDAVACDLHPEFMSTYLAEEITKKNQVPLIRVQHHHAHLASMLLDHNLPIDTSIICITADGFGYGLYGDAWGGEVLLGNGREFSNIGGLDSKVYPGGDLTAVYASRPLISIMREFMDDKNILSVASGNPISDNEVLTDSTFGILIDTIHRGINTVNSSSAGRLLDAIASLLGICHVNSYDGECPMKLESIAKKGNITIDFDFINKDNRLLLDTTKFLETVFDLKKAGESVRELAFASQWYLGEALAQIALETANNEGVNYIGFSGGVALNRLITEAIMRKVAEENRVPLLHRHVPPGDGGISIGQIVVAAASRMYL